MNKIEKGQNVVIRSSQSGVWHGEFVDVNIYSPMIVTLRNARRAWNWEGAASCSGLAVNGPRGGKICEPVETARIGDVCEILLATETATKKWEEIETWKA